MPIGGRSDCLAALVKAGASLDVQTSDGLTPAHVAARMPISSHES